MSLKRVGSGRAAKPHGSTRLGVGRHPRSRSRSRSRIAGGIVACVAILGLAARSDEASAGILGALTGDAVGGAVEKLEPALARTLADVDSRLGANEVRIGNIVGNLVGKTSNELGARLGQVDGILEKRILQVQVGVDQILDHNLATINNDARLRIAQLNGSLAARIEQLNGDAKGLLADADQILHERIGDVGKVVTGAIDQADGVLQARIEQVDEIAGRRLGNVDVIATKQRLGLERTLIRAAWIIGLVVFVIIVLKSLWSEYVDTEKELAATPPGRDRAWRYVTVLGKPLLRHAGVAAVIAVLLAILPGRLPMAAAADQQELIQTHTKELERSLAALDFTRVRFHASQLEFLEPTNAARYQALAAKGELLRDVLGKPTVLATPAGIASILGKAAAVERLRQGQADPDAQTVRAMVAWQAGRTKKDEHEAAARAARALLSTPRGFTLAPMAHLLVEAYVHAPLPPDEEPFNLESTAGMMGILDRSIPNTAGSPFEGAAALFELMRRLDDDSSSAYVAMVEAQVEVARLAADSGSNAESRQRARVDRNAKAREVVKAWETLDEALRATPILEGNALVLGVFRLNDAMLSHALWFTTNPKTDGWPPRLGAMSVASPEDRARKLALAPARTVWARRYASLLAGPARELVELQEADRFEDLERRALDFERALAVLHKIDIVTQEQDHEPVPVQASSRRKRDRGSALPAGPAPVLVSHLASASSPPLLRQLQAANATASLGLYKKQPSGARSPLAATIAGDLAALRKQAEEATKGIQTTVDGKLTDVQSATDAALKDKVSRLMRSLDDALTGRLNRLL